MRKFLLILPLLAVAGFLNGQIANNWTFGYHAGLNFATTPPTFFVDSISQRRCTNKLEIPSTCANSISDCEGNLLFYTNGMMVWNKNHQLMPNCCLNDSQIQQNELYLKTKILKLINNDSLYYIFYSTTKWGLRYAIVNMNADNGNGDIISNHNFINNFYIGGLTRPVIPPELIKHANDTDYWLVCKPTDNEFYSYKISSSGINLNPVISSSGGFFSKVSPLKASISGKYIYYTSDTANVGSIGYSCNFDQGTGIVSNRKTLFIPTDFSNSMIQAYNSEFSSNDSFIYVTIIDNATFPYTFKIVQFKNYDPNPRTSFIIFYSFISGGNGFYLQLAPDGKIYCCHLTSIISCITRPNELGFGCNFVQNYMDISPHLAAGLFPSVYFPLKKLKFNATAYTNTTCLSDSVRLFAQGDTSFLSYRWYFYNTSNVLTDSSDAKNPVLLLNRGAYKVKLRAKNPQCNAYTWWTDDIYVSYKPKIIATLDSIKISCAKQTVQLRYSAPFADSLKVNWGDGTLSVWQAAIGNIAVSHSYYDSSKVYSITINAKNNNCNNTITLFDTVILQPKPVAKFVANNPTKTFPIKGCKPLITNLIDSSKNRDSVWMVYKGGMVNGKWLMVNDEIQDTGWFDIVQYVSTKDGCLDSFSVNKAIYVSPPVDLQTTIDSTYNKCIQNNLRLKIITNYSNSININWGDATSTALNGVANGTKTDTITHNYNTTGWFNVVVTSSNAYCLKIDTIKHFVRWPIQVTTSNDTTVCKGTFANMRIKAIGADSVFSYLLKTPGAMLTSSNGSFFLVPDSTTIFVIGAVNNCANDTIWKPVTITVRPPLKLQLNVVDTTVCRGVGVALTATTTGGNAAGPYQFYLKKNNIVQQTNTTGIFNIQATTNETYTVVVTDNCTVLNDSLSCNIKTFTPLQFTKPLPDLFFCSGVPTTLKALTNLGSGTVTYTWTDAATNATLATADSLVLTPFASQRIIVKATDACSSIYDSLDIYVFATANNTQLTTDATSGCVPLMVNFETPPLTYSNNFPCEALWDFGDGGTFRQDFDNTYPILKAKHIYILPGVYTVDVTIKFKGSTSQCLTFNTEVEALSIPQVKISVEPKKITLPKTQCMANIATFNADSVVIDWGDGLTDNFNTNVTVFTQTHDYSDTGHYMVKATAYNKNTCYIEAYTSVYHADTFMCFIPNVFTPNRDGTNETFKPIVNFCKSYELVIYNRWGEEIFTTKYYDGKNQPSLWTGEGAPMDTYIYKLTATDGDRVIHYFKGTIMLVR